MNARPLHLAMLLALVSWVKPAHALSVKIDRTLRAHIVPHNQTDVPLDTWVWMHSSRQWAEYIAGPHEPKEGEVEVILRPSAGPVVELELVHDKEGASRHLILLKPKSELRPGTKYSVLVRDAENAEYISGMQKEVGFFVTESPTPFDWFTPPEVPAPFESKLWVEEYWPSNSRFHRQLLHVDLGKNAPGILAVLSKDEDAKEQRRVALAKKPGVFEQLTTERPNQRADYRLEALDTRGNVVRRAKLTGANADPELVWEAAPPIRGRLLWWLSRAGAILAPILGVGGLVLARRRRRLSQSVVN